MVEFDVVQDYLLTNQKTWLVTGAAGFIGSNLVERLLILNQKVVGFDNFSTGNERNLHQAVQDACIACEMDMSQNFKFIHGDICNIDECMLACKNADYVLHQAALGSVPRSIEAPLPTNKVNIEGFLNMLEASKVSGIRRFVYASSSSVYGSSKHLPKEEHTSGTPLSPYAVTKAVNELYANVYSQHFPLETIGLRYFNVFGKRQDPHGAYAAVIPRWISAMINGQETFINGDGKTSRDFCYVENAIQMNILSATVNNVRAINQIYNVALNKRTSLKKLHNMIKHKLCERIDHLDIMEPTYGDFRKGDILHSKASIEKAEVLLGYNPKHSVSKGLDKTIDWYLRS